MQLFPGCSWPYICLVGGVLLCNSNLAVAGPVWEQSTMETTGMACSDICVDHNNIQMLKSPGRPEAHT